MTLSRHPRSLIDILRRRETEAAQTALLADTPAVVSGGNQGTSTTGGAATAAQAIEVRSVDPVGADLYEGRVWEIGGQPYVYDGVAKKFVRTGAAVKIALTEIDPAGSALGQVPTSTGAATAPTWQTPAAGGGGGGTVATALVPIGQPQGTLLRTYNFNDGTVQGFTTDAGAITNVANRLRLTAPAVSANCSVIEPGTAANVADGEVEVDIVAGTDTDFGVIFRVTDASNHYLMAIRSSVSGNGVELYTKIAGAYASLGTIGNRNFGTGATTRVLIRFVGQQIDLYINESLQASWRNAQFTTGRVGGRGNLANMTTDFDNIRVFSLASGWTQGTTGGGWPSVLPSAVPGRRLWVKADQITGIDGDLIATWADQSGLANDLVAAGTARPTLKTNILNGLPVVRFNGTTNGMRALSVSLTEFLILIVAKVTTMRMLYEHSDNAGLNDGSWLYDTGDTLRVRRGAVNSPAINLTAAWTNARTLFSIYEHRFTTGATVLLRDNVLMFSALAPVGAGATAAPFNVGARGTATAEFCAVDIAEIIVVDNPKRANYEGLYTYLSAKYGI